MRRRFASPREWIATTAGIAARIQARRPQSAPKSSCIPRLCDLLRVRYAQVEAWIMEQAGIKFKEPISCTRALR